MNIVPFQFESAEVRVVTDEHNEHWFVLRDVLRAMGTSTRPAIAKDDIEQWLGMGYTMVTPLVDSMGRNQDAAVINEPAVTFLVSRSNTETGKRLNRWIHAEVLPSIRKTGTYNAPFIDAFAKATEMVPASVAAAKAFGFEGNQASLSANQAITAVTGVSVLALMGHDGLTADTQAMIYTPTELGKMMEPNIGPRKVNALLYDAGLQVPVVTGGWQPTEEGSTHCEVLDTQKRHKSGAPVKQIKWRSSVLELIGDTEAA